MDLVQTFETTLLGPGEADGDEVAFTFISLPTRRLPEGHLQYIETPAKLAGFLELGDIYVLGIAQISDALLALLTASEEQPLRERLQRVDGPLEIYRLDPDWAQQQRSKDPELAAFADYLAFGDVIPIEQSALRIASLATIAAGSWAAVATKSIPAIAASTVAPPVALALTGVAGSIVVADTVVAVIGLVRKPNTAQVRRSVRRGATRLFR